MKLAVIGLGDIAQKAYLPVYAERSDIEVYLISRDAEKAKRLQTAYRFAGTYATFADAVQEGIDAVMIHSATTVHAEQARQALEAGIAVYVDKPVSMEIEEIRELTRLSEEKQLPFITGFNRRFASAHQRLLEVNDPNLVLMQKNRTSFIEDAKPFLFDDFIHVADTLRFLTGCGEIEDLHVKSKQDASCLHHVTIQFVSNGITAIGVMNRNNGITEERVEVMGPEEKRIATDVTTLDQLTKQGTLRYPLDNWEATLKRRGFVDMLEAFLRTVKGESSESVVASDSLATHELCQQVYEQVQAAR
ncbi:Gfo/Idh/MocA family protein [Exiguobacterium acetylicum]|uniref:Gfo/Idh/MocA family protein n=1 Tax=Exiguobacterium acetylicum TaxID=41170 RepID=UPI00067FB290|nr:Gfo/Idh/MocA family oxidoreductase [Exiguobacterium acetylicum]KNH34701.1 oxidoreductase [Exiguobacterium acetylicum]